MEHTQEAVLGRGWAFPPTFDIGDGVVMAQDLQDIHESLQILFSTQPGERLMRPDFGCDLQASAFENISEKLIAELTTHITDSVLRYETRVELIAVNIYQDPKERNCLQVQVLYQLHGTENVSQLNGQLDILDGGGMVFQ